MLKKLLFIFLFLFTNIIFSQSDFNNILKIELIKGQDKAHPNSNFKFAVKVKINNSWHINSNKPNDDFLIPTQLIPLDNKFQFAHVVFPKAKELRFSFSDKPVSVYDGEFLIGCLLRIDSEIQIGQYKVPIQLRYQACNNESCLPPKSIVDTLNLEVVENTTKIKEINQELFSEINFEEIALSSKDSIVNELQSSSLLISLIIVFLGGLALNLTPCVYPLIPITIGYFGGQSEGRTDRLFFLGLLYVLGMAITYSIIGVITSLSGAMFGALLQNPIVIIGVSLLFVILSLSQFGVYEFKLPDSIVTKVGGAKSGMLGAIFMGLTMGIVAAPCIGPFVLGLVTYVAAKGDPYYGFIMFFVLALGLGLPYLLLALFSGKIKRLPRSGEWMEGVKHIFGLLLLGMAIYFIKTLFPQSVNVYFLPVFGIISGIFLLFFDKIGNRVFLFKIFKIIFSIAVIGISVYSIYPKEKLSPNWKIFSEEEFNIALSNNKKVIIDFYADWCIPCKELDALTFSDREVIAEMKNFVTFKVDMTQTFSEKNEKIRNKFNIVGIPTIIIIDSKGNEVERLTGFVDAKEFLKKLRNVR
ncbi:MAG: protein-disulfide reductase DsbD [Melioribacter sp.]|nr:protein-disulfide reductase DsbD [Melioribacter sp.]